MVQKYAVVDANRVSAPPGATWGNVGRFPGALGGPPVAPNEDVDPVCGMVVSASSAITATFEGKTYHFCSDSCRKKFAASPAAYAAKAVAPPRDAGRRHGCC